MTVTSRRSLPALDRLSNEYSHRISQKYSGVERECISKVEKLKDTRTKEIMEDLEKMCLAKYPHELVKFLKCDNHHSSHTEARVSVEMRYEPDKPLKEIVELEKFRKQIEVQRDKDLKALDDWKMAQLAAMAAGEGMGVLDISFDVVTLPKKK